MSTPQNHYGAGFVLKLMCLGVIMAVIYPTVTTLFAGSMPEWQAKLLAAGAVAFTAGILIASVQVVATLAAKRRK